ncbi:MAG TPA: hypothetical protein PKG93_01620, partial [Bacilli bacterium]|nr:hypothetical protein [Bacilli bacterium]
MVTGGKVSITYDQTRDDLDNYYSLDGGATWITYIGPFENTAGTIQAKSEKRSSDVIIQSSVSVHTASGAINSQTYDGDLTTSYELTYNNNYFSIDSSMYNKRMEIIRGTYGSPGLIFYDANGKTIANKSGEMSPSSDYIVTIPYGAVQVYIYSGRVYEIRPFNTPEIKSTFYHSTLTEYKMEKPYNNVNISYASTSQKKLYRINGGEWKDYYGDIIRLEIGYRIETKGIDKYGAETPIASYTSVTSNDINKETYDGDLTTSYELTYNNNYFSIDSSMYNKRMEIIRGTYGSPGLIFYDANGKTIANKSGEMSPSSDYIVTIPYGAVQVYIYSGRVYEIRPYQATMAASFYQSSIPDESFVTEPLFTLDTPEYSTSKTISITYPTGYNNEYSFDGESWIPYESSITINDSATIFARSIDGDNVISSSSYQITKIDNTVPTINLDSLPDTIVLGTDYSLPSYYLFDESKSSGNVTCTINNNILTSTISLSPGIYTVSCTATSGAGITRNATKDFTVIGPPTTTVPTTSYVTTSYVETSTTSTTTTEEKGELTDEKQN